MPQSSPTRWSMLKQWLLSDGKIDSITVEERFTKWCEQLRTDKYVTVFWMHYPLRNAFNIMSQTIPGDKVATLQNLRALERGQGFRGVSYQGNPGWNSKFVCYTMQPVGRWSKYIKCWLSNIAKDKLEFHILNVQTTRLQKCTKCYVK